MKQNKNEKENERKREPKIGKIRRKHESHYTYLSDVYFVPRTMSGPGESQIARTQF